MELSGSVCTQYVMFSRMRSPWLCYLGGRHHITAAVTEVTDSQYVQGAMTRHLCKWRMRGWINSRGVPISNRDLWEALLRESHRH
jgi:hypothetical protein